MSGGVGSAGGDATGGRFAGGRFAGVSGAGGRFAGVSAAGGRSAGGSAAGRGVSGGPGSAGGRDGRGRRATPSSVDVLVVSLGATGGLIAADRELCDSIRRAGATVELATARRPREVRTFMLTDLMWAIAARRAAVEAIAERSPRAVIYSSVTAALLWPRPGAIRFDALAAGNREGRHGLWQRRTERRRLARSPLLLPWSELSLDEAAVRDRARGNRVIPLPVPVEPSSRLPGEARDIAAITYAANPTKKGLDIVLAAWAEARREGETLLVVGTTVQELRRAGIVMPRAGVELVGMLPPERYRALLRRSRVFVTAPRREDHGIAQLEALADGCMLVSGVAPGPYAALPLAEALDRRLVGDDLRSAIRIALDEPRPDYRARAAEALRPLRQVEVDRVVSERVLPTLLSIASGDGADCDHG